MRNPDARARSVGEFLAGRVELALGGVGVGWSRRWVESALGGVGVGWRRRWVESALGGVEGGETLLALRAFVGGCHTYSAVWPSAIVSLRIADRSRLFTVPTGIFMTLAAWSYFMPWK
jgi:hypothetical protein